MNFVYSSVFFTHPIRDAKWQKTDSVTQIKILSIHHLRQQALLRLQINLNFPRHWNSGIPLSHPILKLEDFPFLIIGPLGVITMGSQYKSEKVGIILAQEELSGLHLVQFECPRHWNRPVSSNFEVGRFPFSDYWTSGVIRMGSQYESEKLE